MTDINNAAERASANIIAIVEDSIKEAITLNELPPDVEVVAFRLASDLSTIEVDLSNDTTMEIGLGLAN